MKINLKKLRKDYGEKADAYLKDKNKLGDLISASFKKLDLLEKTSALEKLWQSLLLLFGLIKDWASGSYKNVSKSSLLLIVIALIYLVNPLDLIPDITPIIGYTDDAAVIAMVIKKINNDLEKYKHWLSAKEIINEDQSESII